MSRGLVKLLHFTTHEYATDTAILIYDNQTLIILFSKFIFFFNSANSSLEFALDGEHKLRSQMSVSYFHLFHLENGDWILHMSAWLKFRVYLCSRGEDLTKIILKNPRNNMCSILPHIQSLSLSYQIKLIKSVHPYNLKHITYKWNPCTGYLKTIKCQKIFCSSQAETKVRPTLINRFIKV